MPAPEKFNKTCKGAKLAKSICAYFTSYAVQSWNSSPKFIKIMAITALALSALLALSLCFSSLPILATVTGTGLLASYAWTLYKLLEQHSTNPLQKYSHRSPQQNWKIAFEKVKKLIQHSRLGIDGIMLNPTYYQELLIPYHPWGRPVFERPLLEWRRSSTSVSFNDYCNATPSKKTYIESFARVCYLDEKQRKPFQIKIEDGRLYYQGELLNTPQDLAFVLGPDDQLYAAAHGSTASEDGQIIKHSSFFSGAPIRAGGLFPKGSVHQGKIIDTINNKTGHYGKAGEIDPSDPTNRKGSGDGFFTGVKENLRLARFFRKHGIATDNLSFHAYMKDQPFTGLLDRFIAKAEELENAPYFHHCNLKGAQYRLNSLGNTHQFVVCPHYPYDYMLLIKLENSRLLQIPVNAVLDGFQIDLRDNRKTYSSIEDFLSSLYKQKRLTSGFTAQTSFTALKTGNLHASFVKALEEPQSSQASIKNSG